MKRLLILTTLFTLAFPFVAHSQVVNPPSGGGTPSGPCGGDLSGTFPNCTVTGSHINAGTINTAIIGGTTPAAGTFTSLVTSTGGIQIPSGQAISNATGGIILLSSPSPAAVRIGITGFSYVATGNNIAAELGYNTTFAPSSGLSNFVGTLMDPIINGTSTGIAYGLVVAPMTNVLTGGTVYAACFGSTTGINLAGLTCPATITPAGALNASSVSVGGTAVIPILRGTLSLTAATTDSATITGVTTSSICTFSPTNSTAAAATVLAFVSSVSANTVVIGHAATVANGGTLNILCSLN